MAKSRKKKQNIPAAEYRSALDPGTPGKENGDAGASTEPNRDRIAHRAYELYVARGGVDGLDLDDWLTAERELSDGERRDET
jgi:hypothetical protein